jgi:RimJ/RimL family protein N-acetyltransferase
MTEMHLAALEEVAFDERIWRYMIKWVKSRDDLRDWVESALLDKANGTSLPWVTVLKNENRVIGSSRLFDLNLKHRTVELGHTWLAPQYQGAGLNAEAKLLQLRHAFDELGLKRVGLKTHHENLQSQAAMRKIGAVEEGTLRNHLVMPDGSARHSVYFSIIREEWPRVRSLLEERVARGSV